MADKPIWEQIGSGFVQHYYQQFDTDRVKLADLYTEASCLTWEGEGFQGKNTIMTKLNSLPFQTIKHIITAQDHQPTPDSCVLSMVMGQLKYVIGVCLDQIIKHEMPIKTKLLAFIRSFC